MKTNARVMPLVILLSLMGCHTIPQQKIALYAYNMLYACECPNYKIFRVEHLTTPQALKNRTQPLDINTTDAALADEITKAINGPKPHSLIAS